MAFTVQDDLGLVNGADAYIDVTFMREYHSDRGNDLCRYTDIELQRVIVQATQFIDNRYIFNGTRLNGRNQSTQFPRSGLFDLEGHVVEGVAREVKCATAEYAFAALGAKLLPTPVTDGTGLVLASVSEEIGPIKESRTFFRSSASAPTIPAADVWLSAFISKSTRLRRA